MSLPRWYALALAERGVKEAPGAADNPIVGAYYRDAGFPKIKHDSVPWCAAFVGAMLTRAGRKPSGSLMARSYLKWGSKLRKPRQGCIVVFPRGSSPTAGHVTFFDREENGKLVCLGGNQSDAVNERRYSKSRVLGYRWPSEAVAAKPRKPRKPASADKFIRCHAVTAKWEGGFVNHPKDPGGATNYGVTQGTYDGYRRRWGLAKRSVSNISADEVRDIYADYWSKVAGDGLPVGVDLAVYDFGVNSGPPRAVKYLQQVVGSHRDGVMGPETLKAVAAMDAADIAARLCDARMAFLKGLPTWRTFGRGWTNRVKDIRAKSVAWAAQGTKAPAKPVTRAQGGGVAAGGATGAGVATVLGFDPWLGVLIGVVLAITALIVIRAIRN